MTCKNFSPFASLTPKTLNAFASRSHYFLLNVFTSFTLCSLCSKQSLRLVYNRLKLSLSSTLAYLNLALLDSKRSLFRSAGGCIPHSTAESRTVNMTPPKFLWIS